MNHNKWTYLHLNSWQQISPTNPDRLFGITLVIPLSSSLALSVFFPAVSRSLLFFRGFYKNKSKVLVESASRVLSVRERVDGLVMLLYVCRKKRLSLSVVWRKAGCGLEIRVFGCLRNQMTRLSDLTWFSNSSHNDSYLEVLDFDYCSH